MKTKKIIAAVLTLTMTVAMSITSFAAPSIDSPTNEDRTVNTKDDVPSSMDIPVFGYIGEDAEIVDTDPTDPTKPPTVTPVGTDIVVSVPVKLMWAAFASNGGAVTAPTYTIENKSSFAVAVELTSFDQTSASDTKDADITLNLTGLSSSATDVVGMGTPLTVGTLAAAGNSNAARTFTIGGTYTGNFGTAYTPTYNMVLTFAIAD